MIRMVKIVSEVEMLPATNLISRLISRTGFAMGVLLIISGSSVLYVGFTIMKQSETMLLSPLFILSNQMVFLAFCIGSLCTLLGISMVGYEYYICNQKVV
jgi:hypothetical protein